MPASRIITLLTDFGTRDYFVGSMKGVILDICSEAKIIDISHEVQPQNILEAAFLLKSTYGWFPKGTIHIVVVDPGVGSGRKPLLAVTHNAFFLAPDNGILSWIYCEEDPVYVYEMTTSRYFLKSPGPTFHARDIFAPAAAWLARGIAHTGFGPEIKEYTKIEFPRPSWEGKRSIKGHVLYIDRFGNLITDITTTELDQSLKAGKTPTVKIKGTFLPGLKRYYAEGEPGEPNALVNSSGHLEIYCYLAYAADILKVSTGEKVTVSFPEPQSK